MAAGGLGAGGRRGGGLVCAVGLKNGGFLTVAFSRKRSGRLGTPRRRLASSVRQTKPPGQTVSGKKQQ